MEKVIDGRIHDKLVLAHVGINIDGKKIYADVEEEDTELSFYFNEGEQLQTPKKPVQAPKIQKPPTPATPIHTEPVVEQKTQPIIEQRPPDKPEAVRERKPFFAQPQEGQVPKIPDRLKHKLLTDLSGGRGVTYYVAERNKLVKEGLLEAGAADIQPEIREAAAQRIIEKMQMPYGDYINETGQVVRAGLLSLEEINNSPYIKDTICQKLLDKLKYGTRAFKDEVDKLVKAGIGTEEEWKKLLYES